MLHILGRIACTQSTRCSLLLQMSHVAWSVYWSQRRAVQRQRNGSRCRLGSWLLWVQGTMY